MAFCQSAESSNALEFLILKNGLNGLICRPGLQTAPLGLSYSASCAIPAPGPLRQFGPLAIARAVLLPPEIIIGFIRAVHTHDVGNFNTLTKSGKMPSPLPALPKRRKCYARSVLPTRRKVCDRVSFVSEKSPENIALLFHGSGIHWVIYMYRRTIVFPALCPSMRLISL